MLPRGVNSLACPRSPARGHSRHQPSEELSEGAPPCRHFDVGLPGLQNLEIINFDCFQPPRLGALCYSILRKLIHTMYQQAIFEEPSLCLFPITIYLFLYLPDIPQRATLLSFFKEKALRVMNEKHSKLWSQVGGTHKEQRHQNKNGVFKISVG